MSFVHSPSILGLVIHHIHSLLKNTRRLAHHVGVITFIIVDLMAAISFAWGQEIFFHTLKFVGDVSRKLRHTSVTSTILEIFFDVFHFDMLRCLRLALAALVQDQEFQIRQI